MMITVGHSIMMLLTRSRLHLSGESIWLICWRSYAWILFRTLDFFLIIPSKFFQFSDQIIPIIYYLGVADWSSIRVTGETLHANSVHFLVYSRENLGKVDSILWCNQQSFTLTFSILGFITGKTGNLLGFDTFLDWHLSKTLPPLLRYQGYFFFIYQC